MTQLLPTVLLAALYGPAVAGWFGLGQRVMGLPSQLLARTASQVFLGEAPGLGDDAAVRRLFLRSTAGFAALGLAGMGPVLVLGPWLFAHVFGSAWREAGTMAALLVPQHLSRFVVIPVSQTLNIYGRQDLHLTALAANGAGLALAFGLAYAVRMDVMTVVGLSTARRRRWPTALPRLFLAGGAPRRAAPGARGRGHGGRAGGIIPASVTPDGSGSPDLIALCPGLGWDRRLRLKQDLLVFEGGGETTLAARFAVAGTCSAVSS